MDYVVLVKEIADPESVVFDGDGLPDPKSRLVTNPRDLNALEAALAPRKDGEKVLAVSVGYQRSVLEEAIGIGADHGYLIDTDAESWDSATASKGIAALVKKLLADGALSAEYLVFAGSAAEDYDNSQTAIRVAELLGIPHLAYCETISLDNGSLTAKVNAAGGYAQVTSPAPALLTVTETANQPRYAAVQRKLKAKRDQSFYTIVTLDELGVTASENVELMATALPKEKPAAKVFSEDTAKNVSALLQAMQDDGRPLGGSR